MVLQVENKVPSKRKNQRKQKQTEDVTIAGAQVKTESNAEG